MKWIGLTGGMGCGKSTVLQIFKELGFGVASADLVVKELYEKKETIEEVCEALDLSTEDFSLSQVSEIVFSDESKLRALESVIHPKVQIEIQKLKDRFQAQNFFAGVYEVPLLFEKNMDRYFDCTICVGASKEIQFARIKKRNNWSDKEIESRLAAQLPLQEKKQRADYYIENSGSVKELVETCKALVKKL